jgi:hypothetical protein
MFRKKKQKDDDGLFDEGRPWERQKAEPDRHYVWFQCYRDIPPVDRTVREAHARFTGKKKPDGAPGQWYTVSQKHRWKERALALDTYIERRDLEAELEERVKSRKLRRAVLANTLRKAGTEMMNIDFAQASPGEVARLLEVLTKQLREEYDETPAKKVQLGGMAAGNGEKETPIVITFSQSQT